MSGAPSAPERAAPLISVVIPALNEAHGIAAVLARVQPLRERGHEVIVVDGGSGDGTPEIAHALADRVIRSGRGRATQMNAGAATARGDILWFLHGDTLAPEAADRQILEALGREGRDGWGRFDVRITGRSPLLRVVARAMNLRSCASGIATGDQGIFVTAPLFHACGGYAAIPLMEDVELSRRLKRVAGRPLCLRGPLITSGRRWEARGVVRTILLMWGLRLAYALGIGPDRLARWYR